ncbi:MAG: 16S rRNA (guanine(527)-N(7))-methyltransferase RsmG [Burkholderiales bacterium]|jgi:16S rRNA (guanine527-N7)-methyltransferase|nr:16S rRNA (guanine(527)-N(7))-methyltransferase RsmG [Burkholderiales bacterium]
MSASLLSEMSSLIYQLDALGVALPEGIAEKIFAYLALLQKWNRTYNLTAIRDPEQMLTHHALDALAIVPALDRVLGEILAEDAAANPRPPEAGTPFEKGALGAASIGSARTESSPRLLDVGSGGGVPGLMLALARPAWQVTMVDAVQKKMAFVTQAITELRLSNAQTLTARVESLRAEALVPPMRYDLAVSRAFSDLTTFVACSRHLLTPRGVWAAMKGAVPDAEIAALPADIVVRAVEELTVPGLDARRHLILLEQAHA